MKIVPAVCTVLAFVILGAAGCTEQRATVAPPAPPAGAPDAASKTPKAEPGPAAATKSESPAAAPAAKTEIAPAPAAPAPAVPSQKVEPAPAAASGESKEFKDKNSYAVGFSLGKSMRDQGVELDLGEFRKGLGDGLSGAKAGMTEGEVRQAIVNFKKAALAKKAAPAPAPAPAPAAGDEAAVKTKASYAFGLKIGQNMKAQAVDPDLGDLRKGLEDAVGSGKGLLSDQEVAETMAAFQKEVEARKAERDRGAGEKNKGEGQAFLAENAKKPGVTVLPSGLQYKVIQMGNGPKPSATDTVSVHYRGTLLDGTEFDSSYSRGEPASFPLNRVIKGWTEGLQLMPVGSKWQFFIPSDLAYQEGGTPDGSIGPNSTLIFEVELISIK